MGIGIVYASDRDRDREREKVFGVEALAGEMMMMKMKFTDIYFPTIQSSQEEPFLFVLLNINYII